MHVTVEDIRSGDDMHRDRMVLSVKLGGGERNRLFFDPERVTRVEIHGGAARAWIHGAFYVALSGGRGSEGSWPGSTYPEAGEASAWRGSPRGQGEGRARSGVDPNTAVQAARHTS